MTSELMELKAKVEFAKSNWTYLCNKINGLPKSTKTSVVMMYEQFKSDMFASYNDAMDEYIEALEKAVADL